MTLRSMIHRVFLQESTTVVKFYDLEKQPFNVPNEGLLKEMGALKVQQLTSDNRIVALTYAYIQGNHKPQELWQFAKVANSLASINAKGYVPGDVRIENIVFGWKEPGVLIDFDLCRKSGTLYPDGYNGTIESRHQRTYCGELMHDMHSLAVILETGFQGAEATFITRLPGKSTAVAALKELANVRCPTDLS